MADSDHSGPTGHVPRTGNIEIPPDEDSGVSDDTSSSVDDSSWAQLDLLGSGLRLVSETVMRKQVVEMEMERAREAWRVEGEKRRAELEDELTRMVVQTQLQIASAVARKPQNRKRKRGEEEDISVSSSREGALLLSLLQCNLFF